MKTKRTKATTKAKIKEQVKKVEKMSREELIELYHKVEEYKKARGRESMQGFTAYTKEDYDFVWFHKVVCKYLDKLERGEIKKLMIFIPPQHGKSELSSRRFPAYLLGRNPELKIALASYTATVSNKFNRDVQNIIDSKEYRDLFPNTRLNGKGVEGAKGELRNVNYFEVVGKSGYFRTVGIRGALTSLTVDFGIIDDPFKDRAEANSETTRNSVWNWYQDVFLTRLHNESRQLLLFTRWHEDDIAGRILNPKSKYYDEEEAKEWVVIALPALKEKTKPLAQAIDINDPREIGEALWEERHSQKKFEKMRKINPSGFTSLAQQRPTAAEGNKIKKEWFVIRDINELPFNIQSIVPDYFIDGAFTDKTKNDETGLGSMYYNKADGRLYILNVTGVRKELYELLKFFKEYARGLYYKANSSVHIELKASGHPLKSMLSKIEHGAFNAIGIPNKIVNLGKYNRVENSEPFLASGRVVLVKGPWNNDFIEQCIAFPNGVHDDMVDVLTYGIHRYFLKNKGGGVTYS